MEPTATKAALTVREITSADVAAITELSAQLGYATTCEEMESRIAALLPLKERHLVLLACLDQEVLAWIEAEIIHHLQSPPHTLITGLVVKEGFRSLGIGNRLCSEIEQWSRNQGIHLLRVTSRSTRERAHQFYLRDGFTQTKTSLVFEKVLS